MITRSHVSFFTVATTAVLIYAYLIKKKKRKATKGIEALVFETPLVEISSLSAITGCTILGKAEFLNVTGSPKGRLALALVASAEKQGNLRPHEGFTIYEGTVGSTGIALAIVARAKGYKCHIVMPANEKYAILEALGATVEKVRPCSIVDPNHFVNVARQRAQNDPKGFFCDQFENPANYAIHYETTGPEIFEQSNGRVDAFVMGSGTGGTLSGVSMYLKSQLSNVNIVLADPQGSGLYNKVMHDTLYAPTEAEGTRKRHQVDTVVEGIGLNRITRNFKIAQENGLIDYAISVSDQEAVDMSRLIMDRDGLFLGSSSAVHLVACVKLAKKMGPGKRIVTLLCDSGTRHLTKFWDDSYLKEKLNITPNPDYFLEIKG